MTDTKNEVPTTVGRGPDGPARIVELPKMSDVRGNLSVIESGRSIPFEFRRIFYLYDIPGSEARGAHAHRALHQFIIASSGSFDVSVDDGHVTHTFSLDRPNCGLYVPPMIWAQLTGFAPGSVVLVLASDHYDEADYYRDYDEFIAATR
jgi:hypothetical protein